MEQCMVKTSLYRWEYSTFTSPEDTTVDTLDEPKRQAQNRNIDTSDNNWCMLLQNQVSSLQWQFDNLTASTRLDAAAKSNIKDFINYGYSSTNYLLKRGAAAPILNQYINAMPALDKDIIVYAPVYNYDDKDNMLPTVPGSIYHSYGYLMTSFDVNSVVSSSTSVLSSMKMFTDMPPYMHAIMKVNVPVGKKCLLVPYGLDTTISPVRDQLIFPHDIKLMLLHYGPKQFYDKNKSVMIMTYEFYML